MSIFTRTLRTHSTALAGWAIAFIAVTSIYSGFYQVMQESDLARAMTALPAPMRTAFSINDVTSPAGYLNTTVFNLVIPILMVVFSIVTAMWVTGADEADGTLDLILAQPVSRTRLLITRFAAVITSIAAAATLVACVVFAVSPLVDLDPPAGNVAAACLHLFALGACFAAVATAIAAVTGRKGAALGASAGMAALTYLANSFLSQIEDLDWIRGLSPFHYYSGAAPMINGVDWGDLCVLAAIVVVALVIAQLIFTRRDIRST